MSSPSSSSSSPSPPPAGTKLRSLRIAAERLAIAHFVAYPLAFAAAVAAIPIAIHLFIDDIERLGDDTSAIGKLVVRLVAWPAALAFLLAHASVAPWALGRDEVLGRRRFLRALVGLGLVVVLFGGASWLWLVLR